ncbi:MAG: cation-translocating P-type ATPase [Chloroflexi bacterium]|nr:cation-translocating P-type ATPase [Chloroflexota bacterium]
MQSVKTRPEAPVANAPRIPWHVSEQNDVLHDLNSQVEQGLSSAEVEARLVKYGSNELIEARLKSPLAILWEQITGPLVLLLIFAAVVSAFLGKADSVIAISAIVILNAVLGVVQEYRAEKAMAALKRMAAALVRVRRNGSVMDIDPRGLVPGDIVLLEAGSVVPADARLVETANLRVQEASLTGESEPVEKNTATRTDGDAPLGDRHNMVYMGTSVTYGRGTAVVVETGMTTQLGRIAQLIQNVEGEKTPLQRRMDELGVVLIRAALAVMAVAIVVGLIAGDTIQDVLLNGVAIAVAVVPEGLPAVVTIALALGAQRMLKRNALIRKLPAVETLGSVTTICSDKTGTLTQNRMTVTMVDVAGQESRLDDVLKIGFNALVNANGNGGPKTSASVAIMLAGDTLCNDAILERGERENEFRTVGDPTETALVDAAAKYGLEKPRLEKFLPRTGEVPFDSERKRMTTVHRVSPGVEPTPAERYLASLLDLNSDVAVSITKGAVDGMVGISSYVWHEDRVAPMTDTWRRRIEESNNAMAANGLRVLGLAFRRFDHPQVDVNVNTVERDLVFVGMVGIIDPPRAEVKEAVHIAKDAGIRPVMITGDHPLTAFAIARELGIAKEGDRILTGQDLAQMDTAQLENTVEHVAVYARVSPEHKLNIVQALQKRGHITAMTGDGVNDAPALKRSDIGVAMGITGTAVSKEASDMVILDDNFATIVSAVEEGRTIYDNVRRFIKYLLASNTGELIVLLVTQLISGMTIPLTTLQILWMNLITDGVPALALGVEKSEQGGMKRPPYAPNESLFGRGLGRHILIVGAVLGITGLALGYWAFANNIPAANGAPAWNTMVFMFLTLAQMGHALGLRSHRESLFKVGLAGNPLLIGAVIVTVILQLIAIYTPFFNNLFNTSPLTLEQLLLCLMLSTVVFWAVELEKLFIRRGVLK